MHEGVTQVKATMKEGLEEGCYGHVEDRLGSGQGGEGPTSNGAPEPVLVS